MRSIFCAMLLLLSSKGFAIYLLVSEGTVEERFKQQAYHEVLLSEDYPMCLAAGHMPISEEQMSAKVQAIHPQLKAMWVPTSLFQLYVLKSFFMDPEFQTYVKNLGYSLALYDAEDPKEVEQFNTFRRNKPVPEKLNIDEDIVNILTNPTYTYNDLTAIFNEINHREGMCRFFLKLNDAFLKEYSAQLLEKIIEQLPCHSEIWKANHFPFWYSHIAQESMERLLRLFSEYPDIIRKVVAAERATHTEGKSLVYRGGEVVFFRSKDTTIIPLLFLPVKARIERNVFVFEKSMNSYSLSYASSFLGGLFLSTDACAARYASPAAKYYTFHVLKVGQKSLLDDALFCIPLFHPFVEMFVEGEWFHPHLKIAQKKTGRRCHGWYLRGNRAFSDHLGFLIRRDCTPEELGAKILRTVAENGVIIHKTPEYLPLFLDNHLKPIPELQP